MNVALCFLWSEREYIAFDFPFDSRIRDFIEYQNDEQFTRDVSEYAQEAAKQVLFYRKMQDIEIAESFVKKWSRKNKKNERISKLNTINHLNDEEVLQAIRQTRAFWHSKPSLRKMKTYEKYDF